ncbi:uncharacterized protein LOC124305618 [Neodiprion virginianus]|uniref:uncharacterized protein LOC124305618 n=1 Tax=Neodiprion virginianus TaxID=2961670 RepID=UPI001EE6E7E5|nr:uncharacterized protein LOC124305618 [Neodiprion virginianus]
MHFKSSAYSTYDKEVVKLLLHVLESNYDLRVNSSILGLANGNGTVEVTGPGLIGTGEHRTFPIFIHQPTIYHKINIVKRSKIIFLAPFANDVWFVLALLLLGVTVALTYVLAREVRLSDSETAGCRRKVRWELSEVLLVSVGALCQQGTTLNPQAPSSRTLFLAIFVMAALVYTAYNASIIAITESFVNSGTVVSAPSLYASDSPYFVLDKQDTEKLKPLYGAARLEITRIVPSQVLLNVLDGSAVLLADRTSTRDIFHRRCRSMKRLCKVKEAPFAAGTYHRVLNLSHDKYKRIINRSLLRLREFGLLERTRRFLFKTWPLCESHGACCSEAISIYLDDVYPAFYLLGAGVGLSLTLLSIELLFFQCSKWFRRRRMGFPKSQSSPDGWLRLRDAILWMTPPAEESAEDIIDLQNRARTMC